MDHSVTKQWVTLLPNNGTLCYQTMGHSVTKQLATLLPIMGHSVAKHGTLLAG
jgi:hypothetical protein